MTHASFRIKVYWSSMGTFSLNVSNIDKNSRDVSFG
jgi:hypothetical protein